MDAIPAATLILLRDGATGPEVLMVERAPTMRFAPGALVFPGGRIDPGDHALARRLGDAALAPRVAAVRETLEEVGIAVGAAASPAAAAAPHGLNELLPFARWCPDHLPAASRFDTWFFLAAAPPAEPVVDATENVRAFWTRPADALDAAARGDGRLVFPTRRVLERLAGFASVAAALADATRWPTPVITPWRELRGGVEHLCIPEGLGYPVTAEPLTSAMRR